MLDENGNATECAVAGDTYRFRGNLFYSGHSPGACIRVIPGKVPELEQNNFPVELAHCLTGYRNGLSFFLGNRFWKNYIDGDDAENVDAERW